MTTITEVRDALADATRVALDLPRAVGFWINPQPLSAYVVPRIGESYLSFENGSFCRPTYALSVLLLGPTNNPTQSSQWLDEHVALAPTIAADDATLGGLVSAVVVQSVEQPGLVAIEGGATVLAAEIRFAPLYLS